MQAWRLLFCIVILAGCATPKPDEHYWTSSVSRYVDSSFARKLTLLLGKIEHGDLAAWLEFASYADKVDGEYGETYSVACAELARRDPTFYLRRYLAGDPASVHCGRKAYGWAGPQGRSLLDAVYAERLYIASDANEREKILLFISATAQWKAT